MTGERVYPPAVWWLPKRVRDALRYEAGMQGIAAQPVGDEPPPECATPETEVTPQPVEGVPIRREPPEASVMPGQIFPPDTDQSSSKERFLARDRSVVEDYHDAAVTSGSNYPCRNPDCMHLAPVPGDACPVCADIGWKAITDFGGDAA